MPHSVDILSLAQSSARHAAGRQSVIAQNMANADTPGYKARDLADFAQTMQHPGSDSFIPRTTRAGHALGNASPSGFQVINSALPGSATPDGNTVAIEDQMVRASEARHQHETALAIYRKSMELMRLGLGRR